METKRCIFVGVGGQGNLLASNLLGQAALSMGIPVVVSEIHGMAQRGGVVESAVLIGEVTSPIVSAGEADVLVSFEPLETMRIVGKCHKNSLVISNSQPQPPFTVAVGQGKYPEVDEFLKKLPAKVGKVIAVRGNDLAEEAGNALSLNMVMLGALFATNSLPVTEEKMKETIAASTKKAFLESNLKAFDLGKKAAAAQM
ncbi:MAG: pyruvate ferredoxin oxidoreductase [Deltaproteobacteria bacterium HGW-Deltaproteobacteria-15]|jgi:indolepyruvate ferredoxin oxidoreductase beta subunit|nr:MAG: pyruvate ferredoxin oxidoreductase [Deltaproteobacteria bacterium HGW-Deltaproteobacteria-15]